MPVFRRVKKNVGSCFAGSTARALPWYARNKIPLLLFVPYDNLDSLWFDKELDPCAFGLPPPGTDYFDAIEMSNRLIVKTPPGILPRERKWARRHGYHRACSHVHQSYSRRVCSAVGGVWGAIAAWENPCALGKTGGTATCSQPFPPRMHLSCPSPGMGASARNVAAMDRKMPEKSASIRQRFYNRKPPYGISGGTMHWQLRAALWILPPTENWSRPAFCLSSWKVLIFIRQLP